MKLKDMGTTGLVEFVKAATTGRQRGLRYWQACRVIRGRHGSGALRRFSVAVFGQ